jgi:hypothetical protein
MRRPFPRTVRKRDPKMPLLRDPEQAADHIRVFHMRVNVTGMTRQELVELLTAEADRLIFQAGEDARLGLPYVLVPVMQNTTVLDVYGEDVGRLWCKDEARERIAGRKIQLEQF